MKIVVVDINTNDQNALLPHLLGGLIARGNELHLITGNTYESPALEAISEHDLILHSALWTDEDDYAASAALLAEKINGLNPNIYLIWNADAVGWAVLPKLDPKIATLAAGHSDSEDFYQPVRHYRAFLTRVIGRTPEICVGLVLSCVIDKECVEWISHEDENLEKIAENYENCLRQAIEDARRAPREQFAEYAPLPSRRLPTQSSWVSRLKARFKF